MPRLVNLEGQKFGFLLVLHREEAAGRCATWMCRCDCGQRKAVRSDDLRQGRTKSCGCYQEARKKTYLRVDGRINDPRLSSIYKTWRAQRRNMRVERLPFHTAWEDPYVFLEDVGTRPPNSSLMLRDRSRGFVPGNVYWSAQEPVTYLANLYNLSPSTTASRLRAGVPLESPLSARKKRLTDGT